MLVNITPSVRKSEAPPGFHLLSKPTGAACNLDCKYCFFLSKDVLYPNERLRMSDEMLEGYIKQLLESHRTPVVTVAWQGGEPTLMGLDFYKRSIEYVAKYRRPDEIMGMYAAEWAETIRVIAGAATSLSDATVARLSRD